MPDLKTIIDSLPMAIFVVDRERRIVLSNPMADRFHCIYQNGARTRRFGDFVGCTNAGQSVHGCGCSENCRLCQVKAMIDQAFAGKHSNDPFETEIRTRSKGVLSLHITVSHIHSAAMLTSRKEICAVTVEDTTEIEKKEKMEAAAQTVGAICHELHQPLQAIMGNVALLATFPLEHRAMARLEKISSEIERIKKITTKMMNHTNCQATPYLFQKNLDIDPSVSI